MRCFGLIGYPLTSSFSKKYFAEKFAVEGIENCLYESYPLSHISELTRLLENPELEGLNVTIPYKKEVIPFLHYSTDAVKKMGACNCIKMDGGKLTGHNTDVTGFEQSFIPLRKTHHTKALILGTGGAAAAVEFVMNGLGIDHLFVSRKNIGERTIAYEQINKQVMDDFSIIINTTPLGMMPDVNAAPPIPYQLITEKHYLYDLVYNPAETLFLKKGKERGATVKNGEDMLIIQAEESWKIWNELR